MRRTCLLDLRYLFILVLMASLTLAACGSQSSNGDLTAGGILDQMANTYAQCSTYQDSGVVTTTFIQSDRSWVDEKPFSTAFVRPSRFRFEFKEQQSSIDPTYITYVIWRNGEEVLSWWDVTPGIKTEDSLDMAIAGATGVSFGSAHTIPPLLMPDEISGRLLTDITEAQRIDDAEIDSVNCYRIQGKFSGDPITIWIEVKTFLVRRIETGHIFSDFSTQAVTTYSPVVNGVITDDMLAFNPPI